MAAFIIFDETTGVVRGTYTASYHDAETTKADNTPAGCGAMAVDLSHPVVTGQKGWYVFDGALELVPPSPAELLATAQTTQSATIEAAYQNATFATAIPYMGTTFWTDQNSQSLLMGAMIGYSQVGGTPAGFMWWDSTNTGVPMTLAQLQGLYQAIMQRINANFVKRKELLAIVVAATTVDAAQAVVWE